MAAAIGRMRLYLGFKSAYFAAAGDYIFHGGEHGQGLLVAGDSGEDHAAAFDAGDLAGCKVCCDDYALADECFGLAVPLTDTGKDGTGLGLAAVKGELKQLLALFNDLAIQNLCNLQLYLASPLRGTLGSSLRSPCVFGFLWLVPSWT